MHYGIILVACSVILGSSGFAQSKVELKTKQDKISYGLGMSVGRNFKQQEIPLDLQPFIQGFKDGFGGTATALPDSELQALLETFSKEMMEKQAAKGKELVGKNKKAVEAFVAQYRKKAGVVALSDGILYRVVTAGTGPKPTVDKTVVCNYRGTLIDGTEFDSSSKWGGPATFRLGEVIRGWQEILSLMPTGSKWEAVIPAELAYGDRGSGELIGPGATLVFEIELLSIK
jgi:FKBP-type peptidyl-prolyl cis-trans isomerase FklB